jgi:hypothetical protein
MRISARLDPTAVDMTVSEAETRIVLADGRELPAPLAWLPRLRDTTPEQWAHWRLVGRGEGIHWPSIDEHVSIAGLLRSGGADLIRSSSQGACLG